MKRYRYMVGLWYDDERRTHTTRGDLARYYKSDRAKGYTEAETLRDYVTNCMSRNGGTLSACCLCTYCGRYKGVK